MLKDYFYKPIDRQIDGVIKADSYDTLKTELEEYVVTTEINNMLGDPDDGLFAKYTDPKTATNGVWISGFFGTGKSHFLKILSYLFENANVAGRPVIDYFKDKRDRNEGVDSMLLGQMQKVTSIPSKSILFNIDSIAKGNNDDITAVTVAFMKAFDDSCGYYGNLPFIATLERSLDDVGLYGTFKENFKNINILTNIANLKNKTWEEARIVPLAFNDQIAEAYAKTTGQSVDHGFLTHIREDNKDVTVEIFADTISAYLKKQPSNFHINFFVDEVGQYIADNVHKMVSLQTIAEMLATKCKGRSWVFITAQANLDSMLKNKNEHLGDDFSKIQGRFGIKINLTEKNVNEVIQKRLLLKNEIGKKAISALYNQEHVNFKTLFTFVDGPKNFPSYHDKDEFIASYPFVTYQYDLFAQSLIEFSIHDAFTGEYNSTGARSMLDVFHKVVTHIGDMEEGTLVTFDMMYSGLVALFRPNVYGAISKAENAHVDAFAIRVLKTLLLVKYLKNDFKATIHNISVLMYPSFGTNPANIQEQVAQALMILENETCIQKTGDIYDYLTNDEKDVQTEIKNVSLDSNAMEQKLNELVFSQLIKSNKILYEANKTPYQYTKQINGRTMSKECDLSINVVTDSGDEFNNPVAMNDGNNTLLILLGNPNDLLSDLRVYLQTEKYAQTQSSMNCSADKLNTIIIEQKRNIDRSKIIEQEMENAILTAQIYAGSTPVPLSGTTGNALTRIRQAFQSLVAKAYPFLGMLGKTSYSDDMIGKAFAKDNITGGLSEAATEIFSAITSGKSNGLRVTVKTIIEKFSKKPYGWSEPAIEYNLCTLVPSGKINIKFDGQLIDDRQLQEYVINSSKQDHLGIDVCKDIPTFAIGKVREFIGNYTVTLQPNISDPRELGRQISNALKRNADEIDALMIKGKERYPFITQLEQVRNETQELMYKQDYEWFFSKEFLDEKEERLLDWQDELVRPISAFFKNQNLLDTFEQARAALLRYKGIQEDIDPACTRRLEDALSDKDAFKGQNIQKLILAAKEYTDAAENALQKIKEKRQKDIQQSKNLIDQKIEYQENSDPKKKEMIDGLYRSLEEKVAAATSKVELEAILPQIENAYAESITALIAKPAVYTTTKQEDNGKPVQIVKETPEIKTVSIKDIKPSGYSKLTIASEKDIDDYLSALKKELLEKLGAGYQII